MLQHPQERNGKEQQPWQCVTSGESSIWERMTLNVRMVENRAQRRGASVPNQINISDGVS